MWPASLSNESDPEKKQPKPPNDLYSCSRGPFGLHVYQSKKATSAHELYIYNIYIYKSPDKARGASIYEQLSIKFII